MGYYIIYSTTSLGLCWLIYTFLLKNEKSFLFNRYYLLGSIVICLLAPILNFEMDVANENFAIPEILNQSPNNSSPNLLEKEPTHASIAESNTLNSWLPQMLIGAYVIICMILLIRFIKNLSKIIRLIQKKDAVPFEGIYIIPTKEEGNPFSFFKYIFINKKELEKTSISSSILKHEAAHSQQLHSVDILFIELLSCIFWFNPFLWLCRKAILINHEFLADAAVIRDGIDVQNYSNQLIQAGNKSQHFQLISGFNFVQTKRRLLMIHTNGSNKIVKTVKKFSVSTFLLLIFLFCSFTINKVPGPNQDSIPAVVESPVEVLTIPFAVVEESPVYPGCENIQLEEDRKNCFRTNIASFVSDNFPGDATRLLTQPEGYNVTVVFRISEKGEITNVRARATSPKLDLEDKAVLEQEAIRVIKSIPQLKPGKHNGKVVGVDYAVRL